MILQSHSTFDQLAEFDPNLTSVRFLSRKQHPELADSITGSFAIVNEVMVAFYRVDRVLYFRIAENAFELTDDVRSTLETHRKYRKFRLLKGENVLADLTYLIPRSAIPLGFDPTPFVEEEDFDFLLFVHNVLTEPDRRNRVWNQ